MKFMFFLYVLNNTDYILYLLLSDIVRLFMRWD